MVILQVRLWQPLFLSCCSRLKEPFPNFDVSLRKSEIALLLVECYPWSNYFGMLYFDGSRIPLGFAVVNTSPNGRTCLANIRNDH